MRNTPKPLHSVGPRHRSTPQDENNSSHRKGGEEGFPSNLESIIQVAIQALPRSEGGFIIEVRPIAATRGSSGSLRHRNTERQTRGMGRSGDNLEIYDGVRLGDANSSVDNWRPKGRAVLTLSEVAQALSLSRTTVYRLIQDGKLGVIHVGRRVLVLIEVVEAFLASGPGAKRCA